MFNTAHEKRILDELIKVGKKKYRFSFDKKGRAYQANKAAMGKTGVLVKKIKGKYYGFDYQGHMVKGLRG